MKDTGQLKLKNITEFSSYKGRPLVRCGNTLYYGDISDRYVVKMDCLGSKTVSDLQISTNVSIEMIDKNSEYENTKKIVKMSEKPGLYPALDIATIWLERAHEKN